MKEEYDIDDFDELELGGQAGETADGNALFEHFRCEVDLGQVPVRIDKYLFERMQHSSRNRIQAAAEAGFIFVNNRQVKSNYKVRPGDVITLMLRQPKHDTTIYCNSGASGHQQHRHAARLKGFQDYFQSAYGT